MLGAPRPAPLLHRAPLGSMSPGLYLLADESWGSGLARDMNAGTGFRLWLLHPHI